MKNEPIVINNKKTKQYFIVDDTKVYFNSDFDNGNLQKVEQTAPYIVMVRLMQYKIYPGFDKIRQSTNKTFFHFKVFGFSMCTVRFYITRLQILQTLLKKNQTTLYQPVFRKQQQEFQRLGYPVDINLNKNNQVQLSFTFEFDDEAVWYQFAFSYPYSYENCNKMIKNFRKMYQNHSQIYYHDELIGYSTEKRQLQLITITEKVNCQKTRQQPIEGLFPQGQNRPFNIYKPKIIISGRVHPGEVPASFCIEGLIRFLLNQKDYRAYLLRKNFHFIIIPMLNPDGVYHGMFRADINGDNLNRVYQNCSQTKHPTIWQFRKLLEQLKKDKDPVGFYFDFHAHPSKKQFFIYGNAFGEFVQQIEAETFGKIIENNCPYFRSIDNIFNEKQMIAKDKIDNHSKEGCARVYTHKLFNLIHSYTVQCGYFSPGKLKNMIPINFDCIQSQDYKYTNQWEKPNTKFYTPESYMLMGKSIMISVLDLFHLNPYTRINGSQYHSVHNIRKIVASNIFNKAERFRMNDGLVNKKMKNPTQIIQQNYYKIRFGAYALSVSEDHGIKFLKKSYSLNSKVYQQKNISQNKLSETKNQWASGEKVKYYVEKLKSQDQQNGNRDTTKLDLLINYASFKQNQQKKIHGFFSSKVSSTHISLQKQLLNNVTIQKDNSMSLDNQFRSMRNVIKLRQEFQKKLQRNKDTISARKAEKSSVHNKLPVSIQPEKPYKFHYLKSSETKIQTQMRKVIHKQKSQFLPLLNKP